MAQKRRYTLDQVKAESPPTPVGDCKDLVVTRSRMKKRRLSASAQTNEPSPLSADIAGDINIPPIEIDPGATQRSAQKASNHKIAKKYTKHDTYWLLGGDVFVQIDKIRFKLHRYTLVKQSNWFRVMIENPPHNKYIHVDEETGAAVYVLDSLEVDVKDFVVLLDALDNAISYAHESLSFKFVASILRAAAALDFYKFRAFAISYLEKMWPNELEDAFTSINYAADTVFLARRWNINSILKRALYELVISEGFKQSEMDQIDPDIEDRENQSVLTVFDFSLLVHTREQLTKFWMQKVIPPPQPDTCQSPRKSSAYQTCAVTRRKTHELYKILFHDSKIFERYRDDPILGLRILRNAPWTEGEVWPGWTHPQEELLLSTNEVGYLCSVCAEKWKAIWRGEMTKLWSDMDIWFKLRT